MWKIVLHFGAHELFNCSGSICNFAYCTHLTASHVHLMQVREYTGPTVTRSMPLGELESYFSVTVAGQTKARMRSAILPSLARYFLTVPMLLVIVSPVHNVLLRS